MSAYLHQKVPFNLIKSNLISNKTFLNPLKLDFYLDPHRILLIQRNQPPSYPYFFQIKISALFPEKLIRTSYITMLKN